MEKPSHRQLRSGETGTALVVVLLMLLILLPMTLVLGRLVTHWQSRAARFVGLTEIDYAARAGFEAALSRLGDGRVDLDEQGTTVFELDGLAGRSATVRITRHSDAIVSLEGRVLEGLEASRVDLEQMALDPDGRRVHTARKFKVCLVEVVVSGPPRLGGVRLWGVVVQTAGGPWRRAGLRVDRGFF